MNPKSDSAVALLPPLSGSVSLWPRELEILEAHYLHHAKKWEDSESTNLRLARKYSNGETGRFTGGPCEGEPQTPANWLKRAEVFRRRKERCLERAAAFRPQNVKHEARLTGSARSMQGKG